MNTIRNIAEFVGMILTVAFAVILAIAFLIVTPDDVCEIPPAMQEVYE